MRDPPTPWRSPATARRNAARAGNSGPGAESQLFANAPAFGAYGERTVKCLWIGCALAVGLGFAGTTVASKGEPRAAPAPSHLPITMYVLPQCGYCEKARQLLTARGASWRELDIAVSPEAKREFDGKGGVGTPLLVIGGAVIQGFDAPRIEAAIAARRPQPD